MSKALLKGLALTLKYFFRRPVTVEYPEEKRPVPERFRGRPALLAREDGMPRCVACGLCEKICPSLCIIVSAGLPCESLAAEGVELRQADLYSAASPEDALFALADRHTRLMTVSSIQSATGLRLDIERIGEFCKRRGILFCIDAIQSLGAMRFDVQACKADFIMADGHKWLFGPEGLGVFYTTPEARDRLKLTQFGWHMMKDTHNYENRPWEIHPTARRFECGSPNMLGIHALSASVSLLLEAGMEAVEASLLAKIDYLRERIDQHPELELLSPAPSPLKSGIVVFKHKTISNAALYNYLMQKQVLRRARGGRGMLREHPGPNARLLTPVSATVFPADWSARAAAGR